MFIVFCHLWRNLVLAGNDKMNKCILMSAVSLTKINFPQAGGSGEDADISSR